LTDFKSVKELQNLTAFKFDLNFMTFSAVYGFMHIQCMYRVGHKAVDELLILV